MANNKSLLSSDSCIQAPWVKVTIGNYTFGVFDKQTRQKVINAFGESYYTAYAIQYPNYINSLNITKVNGQVNQYTLNITYQVTAQDDPNFFEKVFSSVSSTRKIVFSYGDAYKPAYVYKNEEAIITKISQNFNINSSAISYTIQATSTSLLANSGSYTFLAQSRQKPSTIIKNLFKNKYYGLQDLFTGMNVKNLNTLIAGDDQAVAIDAKTNISVLNYINYLVGCMIPIGQTSNNATGNQIYVLTISDDSTYGNFTDSEYPGPYFKVTKTSSSWNDYTDAYTLDIGVQATSLVTSLSFGNNDAYSLYYNYQNELHPNKYAMRLDSDGNWVQEFAPGFALSKEDKQLKSANKIWWSKVTQYPITATVTIQGLLRPAQLMTYVRMNIIFPGGNKHINSGLYIVTSQQDSISAAGYTTTLSLTRISGDI